jgi:type IV pilus assembly protein PilB
MSSAPFDSKKLAEFLHESILFQDAQEAELQAIAKRLEHVRFKAGDPIVLENQISDHVYFVYRGSVEVVKHLKELNQLHRLAVLSAGRQFSEFSVLNRATKAASVFALEDCELLRMSGENFLQVLEEFPVVGKRLVLHLADMTHCVQTSRLQIGYVKTDMFVLNNQILEIYPAKFWNKFEALPIRLEGRNLYVALKDPQNQIFYQHMRQNYANLNIYVHLVNDADFAILSEELVKAYQENQRKPQPIPPRAVPAPLASDIVQWLPQVSLFRGLPQDWFPQLKTCFTYESYKAGQLIYKKGDPSQKLYIVQSGQVEVQLPLVAENAAVFVGTISPGEYFSEVSLLTKNPHQLSARAATDVTVAVLDKSYLERFLDVSIFSIALATDLAVQFQQITSIDGFSFFDPKQGVQVKELASILPASVINQYEILPLRLKENELTIGITNPESETIFSVISRYLSSYRVKLEVIKASDFKVWVKALAASGGETQAVEKTDHATIARGDTVAIVNKIFKEGFDSRASDIHIEPQADHYVVRFRIDGVLREFSEKYAKALGVELISRLKIISQLDTTNKFTPQDGQMKLDVDGASLAARISILPTKFGENAVARLIREKSSVPPLATLAPDQRVIQILREVTKTKQGVFLVTGPTGSGKSTTLYSLIQELNRVEVSIISLEDPVEMTIGGTTQVEMNEKQGLTFSGALRSALRQDPNVIIIGEIRDEESAKIAFHAASTGHLVISTLHTNSSINVVPRLLELGVSRGNLASTLVGASAQRLVRQNCKKCLDSRPITAHEAEVLQHSLGLTKLPATVTYGKGCSACGQSGYYGRLPVIEVWSKTPAIEVALSSGINTDELESLMKSEGFETFYQFALKMVLNGLTTVAEVQRSLGGALSIKKKSSDSSEAA